MEFIISEDLHNRLISVLIKSKIMLGAYAAASVDSVLVKNSRTKIYDEVVAIIKEVEKLK